MNYQWAIGTYKGEQAKRVKAQAEMNIGYFIQREGGAGGSYTITAACRRPMDGLRPEHLEEANLMQVQKLEQLYEKRHGIQKGKH